MRLLLRALRPMVAFFVGRWVCVLLLTVAAPAWPASEPPLQVGIASAQPLATQAGQAVLAAGGNAFDATIAVTAALAVVEPYSSGLGGGGFFLLHRASDGHQVMVDARETAPTGVKPRDYFDAQGNPIP